MSILTIPPVPSLETELKRTTSRCPVCHSTCAAIVFKLPRGDREHVFMRRSCAVHGTHTVRISTDARFYWLAAGNPENKCGDSCACSASKKGKNAALGSNATDPLRIGLFEKLSTCLALIEIVDSCNLACPTCYAASPKGSNGSALKYRSYDELTGRIQGVIDRKGPIEILQFSGGEPTIHPQFYKLVDWVCSHSDID